MNDRKASDEDIKKLHGQNSLKHARLGEPNIQFISRRWFMYELLCVISLTSLLISLTSLLRIRAFNFFRWGGFLAKVSNHN